MALIKLSEGFKVIDEGDYTFEITEVTVDKFNNVEITLEADTGETTVQRYGIGKGKQINEGALRAFSFFARRVTGSQNADDIDTDDLEGLMFTATVEHEMVKGKKDPTKTYTNVRINDIVPLEEEDDFDED